MTARRILLPSLALLLVVPAAAAQTWAEQPREIDASVTGQSLLVALDGEGLIEHRIDARAGTWSIDFMGTGVTRSASVSIGPVVQFQDRDGDRAFGPGDDLLATFALISSQASITGGETPTGASFDVVFPLDAGVVDETAATLEMSLDFLSEPGPLGHSPADGRATFRTRDTSDPPGAMTAVLLQMDSSDMAIRSGDRVAGGDQDWRTQMTWLQTSALPFAGQASAWQNGPQTTVVVPADGATAVDYGVRSLAGALEAITETLGQPVVYTLSVVLLGAAVATPMVLRSRA